MLRDLTQDFPSPNVAVLEKNTDVPSTVYQFLFQSLFNRTGGESGIFSKVDANLTAKGATQATALALNKDWNEIATTPAGSGVMLFNLLPGMEQTVFNAGANALKVYPFSKSPAVHIDALGNNAAYSLAAGKEQTFKCWTDTHLRSTQLG
jgi:hypothetical protein